MVLGLKFIGMGDGESLPYPPFVHVCLHCKRSIKYFINFLFYELRSLAQGVSSREKSPVWFLLLGRSVGPLCAPPQRLFLPLSPAGCNQRTICSIPSFLCCLPPLFRPLGCAQNTTKHSMRHWDSPTAIGVHSLIMNHLHKRQHLLSFATFIFHMKDERKFLRLSENGLQLHMY